MFASRTSPPLVLLLVIFSTLLGSCRLSAFGTPPFYIDGHAVNVTISQKGNIPACSESELRMPDIATLPTVDQQNAILGTMAQNFRTHPDILVPGDRFDLDTPLDISGKSLEIRLVSSAPILECELFESASQTTPRFRTLLFPPVWSRGSQFCSFQIPLSTLPTLGGFRISALSSETRLSIESARISAPRTTFNFDTENTALPAGARLLESKASTLLDFSGMQRNHSQKVLAVRYQNQSENPGANRSDQEIDLTVSDGSANQSAEHDYSMRIRTGTNSVYLYETAFDFVPQRLLMDRKNAHVQILDVLEEVVDTDSGLSGIPGESGLQNWHEKAFTAPVPLPADLHELLNYPQKAWRQDFMEVFSWNLFPGIFVLDFVNLDVQDRFLKRLIYFTEKKGFRGTIQPNEVINPLHGWNANDFRAESIAAFYSEVARSGFDLNPEEILLRNCLLQWGVIQKKDNAYAALSGGLLTLARGAGMSSFNRTLLLQHECLHGVFFSRPDFRSAVETEMAAMDESARNFMISYFSFYQYDPTDHYLMVNEFQAYLLQQPLENLRSYITQNMVNTFGQYNPDGKREFRAQAWDVSDSIYKSARTLSDELYRETGLVNGQLSCLVNR